VALEAATDQLARLPHEDLGFASIDHHRTLRRGHCETIFCAGKTTEQVVAIAERMVAFGHENILATRARGETLDALEEAVPVRVDRTASLAVVNPVEKVGVGQVFVVAAGTSDIPVAEEAALTAECSGSSVERVYDVGVAGIHRLLAAVDRLSRANVIIAVAGMEGALPTVVAGLVGCPVIAVPTSVGYGASFGGLAALLTMLNSCAPGISVVNIDNGFGAGYSANVINLMAAHGGQASAESDMSQRDVTLRAASGGQS
jgi:NCAIR mutase (PurE)-related protein